MLLWSVLEHKIWGLHCVCLDLIVSELLETKELSLLRRESKLESSCMALSLSLLISSITGSLLWSIVDVLLSSDDILGKQAMAWVSNKKGSTLGGEDNLLFRWCMRRSCSTICFCCRDIRCKNIGYFFNHCYNLSFYNIS